MNTLTFDGGLGEGVGGVKKWGERCENWFLRNVYEQGHFWCNGYIFTNKFGCKRSFLGVWLEKVFN